MTETRIVALSAHARHVSATERARFAAAVENVLAGAREPYVLVDTCHRVEVYLLADGSRIATELPPAGTMLEGAAAARQAISLACGLDSVVLGEDQVLHQLRGALAAARRRGPLGPSLERLFAVALQTGRRARSWRQGPARSLADVAVERLEAATGPLHGRRVLVVGSGPMGRLALRAAQRREAVVSVASRRPAAAEAVAGELGARAVAWDAAHEVAAAAAIVVALRGNWRIGVHTADALAGGEMPVVDLSTPAALDPAVRKRLDGRYVSVDALLADPAGRPDGSTLVRSLALVDRATEDFCAWLEGEGRRAAIQALADHAERERQEELVALWRRLPELDPETRAQIEGMSRHLIARLLREPLQRLRQDPDGRQELAARDLFGL
jgi:glutamyl-tRNA reductase